MSDKLAINLTLRIATSPERIWQALTEPAQLAAWLCEARVMLPKGQFELHATRLPDAPEESPTQLLEATPNRCLAFDWRFREHNTTVTINITPLGNDGAEVRVHHSGLTRRPDGK